MRTRPIFVGAALFVLNLSQAVNSYPPTTATRTFLDAHPSAKVRIRGDRVTALYGGALDSAPGGGTDAFVQAFVDTHKDAFGVDGAVLTKKSDITISNGRRAVYTYTQTIPAATQADLPAHGSVVTIVVQLGLDEGTSDLISYVGIWLLPHPASELPLDTKTEQDAQDAVTAAYPQIDTFDTMTKVNCEQPGGTPHRAYRFSGSGGGDAFLFLVDTSTAEILQAQSQIRSFDLSGNVTGYATPNTKAHNATTNPAVLTALPGVPVRVYNDPNGTCPPDESEAEDYETLTCESDPVCGGDGDYSFTGIPGTGRVSAALSGPWGFVSDCLAATFCHIETYPVSEKCELISGSERDLQFDLRSPPDDETDVGLINAFLAVSKGYQWFTGLFPESTALDNPGFEVFVNASRSEGSGGTAGYSSTGWDPVWIKSIYFNVSGTNSLGRVFNNMAFSTVVSHEYGHATLDAVTNARGILTFSGKTPDDPPSFSGEAIEESIADVISSYVWDTPIIGEGLFNEPAPLDNFVRRLDEPNVVLGDLSTLPSWCNLPPAESGHCISLAGC